jgi:RsmE family RNA methyltransferase
MNILLFQEVQKNNEVCIRCQEKINHVKDVLKLKEGDHLRIGQLNGDLGTGSIISLNEEELKLKVSLNESPPEALPCSIILALPRPQQFKRILVHLSSLGVKDIHLIQSERVEKNYWQSPKLKDTEKYLIEGLEQAQDTVLPSVFSHKNFKRFIEKDFAEISKEKQAWIAHPGEYPAPKEQTNGQHLIIIGPEGGFIPEEVEMFQEQGARTVSLGKRILKVETALPVLLGKLFSFI